MLEAAYCTKLYATRVAMWANCSLTAGNGSTDQPGTSMRSHAWRFFMLHSSCNGNEGSSSSQERGRISRHAPSIFPRIAGRPVRCSPPGRPARERSAPPRSMPRRVASTIAPNVAPSMRNGLRTYWAGDWEAARLPGLPAGGGSRRPKVGRLCSSQE